MDVQGGTNPFRSTRPRQDGVMSLWALHVVIDILCHRHAKLFLVEPLGGTPSLHHLLRRGCPSTHLPTAPSPQTWPPLNNADNLYASETAAEGFTLLNIDQWALVPVECPSDTFVPWCCNTHAHTKLWAWLEHKVRVLDKGGSFLHPGAFLSLSAYRAGLPCHWNCDTGPEGKIPAASHNLFLTTGSEFVFLVGFCLAL